MSGHCRIFHVQAKTGPSPVTRAMYSAVAGPASTSAKATRTNAARAMVSTTARSRTFHHGRPSSMS